MRASIGAMASEETWVAEARSVNEQLLAAAEAARSRQQEVAQKVEDSMVGVVVPTSTGAAEPGVKEVAKEEAA